MGGGAGGGQISSHWPRGHTRDRTRDVPRDYKFRFHDSFFGFFFILTKMEVNGKLNDHESATWLNKKVIM